MSAYICDVCDNMFCSHEVNFYHCDKCDTSMCEDCWIERLSGDQEIVGEEICGNCYEGLRTSLRELTE